MDYWEKFFREKIKKIFLEKNTVIDIGGGLRISPEKGNRYDKNNEWLKPYVQKVDYKILDPVPDYHPDIIGDIHNLPLADNSVDAIVCLAVLEHVENPLKATAEIHRVLKSGGFCLIQLPFLYYYHAERGYYKDYWRFTEDAVELLFKDFSKIEKINIRGALSTWLKISPLGRHNWLMKLAGFFDKIFKKNKSRQVSDYCLFLIK